MMLLRCTQCGDFEDVLLLRSLSQPISCPECCLRLLEIRMAFVRQQAPAPHWEIVLAKLRRDYEQEQEKEMQRGE